VAEFETFAGFSSDWPAHSWDSPGERNGREREEVDSPVWDFLAEAAAIKNLRSSSASRGGGARLAFFLPGTGTIGVN
jgi:hypothetical protein